MNIELLIKKAKELGLSYLRVSDADEEVELQLPVAAAMQAAPAAAVAPPSEKDVTTQLVGYFRPVAEVGSRVEQGAVIAVIESLGLPNEILAPVSGSLSEFQVSDGEPVEYGTVLARIKS